MSTEKGNSFNYQFLILAIAAICYSMFCITLIDADYIDFGDGNYLYISKRVYEGVILYKEILSPQPPNHIMTGVFLMWLGNLFNNPLFTVRIFSLFIHIVTMIIVVLLANRITRDRTVGMFAGIIYLMLPIGFWWSLGYQSESLEIIFLLLCFYFILKDKQWSYWVAGTCATLAICTNMTALPYLVLHMIYLVSAKRKRILDFIIPAVMLATIYGVVFSIYSGSAFWTNVWTNQVGTYPINNLLSYAFGKIYSEGLDIFVQDGVYILLCICGILVYLEDTEISDRIYVTWYALFSMGSILFVTKGGTADYIFCIAEPMVAIFAGYFLYTLLIGTGTKTKGNKGKIFGILSTRYFLVILLLINIFVGSVSWMIKTYEKKTYEHPASEVMKVVDLINQHSGPRDMILAPPFYAFLTDRVIPAEASESFIWYIKWYHSKLLDKIDPDVEWFSTTIKNSLHRRDVKIVLLNRNQYGHITPIARAVEESYRKTGQVIQSRHETLDVYLPRPMFP